MAGKVCQICGKPSGIYPLCTEHLQKKAEGLIVKCDNCGKWHWKKDNCECKKGTIIKIPNICDICGKNLEKSAFPKLCAEHRQMHSEGKVKLNHETKKFYIVDNAEIFYNELPTAGFNNCILCNKPSNGYAFCLDCYRKNSNYELLQILNKTVVNKKPTEEKNNLPIEESAIEHQNIEEKQNNVIIINKESKSKCITCGRQTEGLLFCTNCYNKYKNKELLFKIKNCSEVELLDDSYEGIFNCRDGHIVKSKSEREIDNYLFENRIRHAYEKELRYGSKDNEKLHPDFFLPDYLGEGKGVYIEHWGYNENNIMYTRTKKFKLPLYEKLGITLVCLSEKDDIKNLDSALDYKLNPKNIIEGKINFND